VCGSYPSKPDRTITSGLTDHPSGTPGIYSGEYDLSTEKIYMRRAGRLAEVDLERTAGKYAEFRQGKLKVRTSCGQFDSQLIDFE
jgi:hypothetical protein